MKSAGALGLLCIATLILRSSIHRCDATKILLIPANIDSHVSSYAKLAELLSREGHQINLLIPSNSQKVQLKNYSYDVTTYPVKGDTPFLSSQVASKWLIQSALSDSSIEKLEITDRLLHHFISDMSEECFYLLKNKKLMREIKEGQYEFVILDFLTMNCHASIPTTLNIPYGAVSLAWSEFLYRITELYCASSYDQSEKGSMTVYLDQMSFAQRLEIETNVLGVIFNSYSASYEKGFTTVSNELFKLYTGTSLWIILQDQSLGHPRPSMPNTVTIGDLMAGQKVQPLSSDLELFIHQHHPEGVILVSFGRFWNYLPREVEMKLCNVFRSLRYGFIWKNLPGYCDEVPNVKLVSTMPQTDLLATEDVRMMLGHAEMSSLTEALYHAKPLIIFPIDPDQTSSVATARSKGYAVLMDLATFTEAELTEAIKMIAEDPSYQIAAKKHSAIMKDKLVSSGSAVSHLIQHVLKFGDSHLKPTVGETDPFPKDWELKIWKTVILALLSITTLLQVTFHLFCAIREIIAVRRREDERAD